MLFQIILLNKSKKDLNKLLSNYNIRMKVYVVQCVDLNKDDLSKSNIWILGVFSNEDDADNWWKTKRSRILDDIAVIINCPSPENAIYTDHEVISGRKKKMKLYLIY